MSLSHRTASVRAHSSSSAAATRHFSEDHYDHASLPPQLADQENDEQYCVLMATRRTVPVEIGTTTVAIAELAAARDGVPVAEWIARAARREFASINPGPNYVEFTEAEMVAEDAERAADEAAIAADEAKRFRAAG